MLEPGNASSESSASVPAEPSNPQEKQGSGTKNESEPRKDPPEPPKDPPEPPKDPPEPPYAVKLLWEEFKLTQDKIDRIGDFHFRVRTWAITLSTALVVAGIANEVPWWAYLATLPLIVAFNLIDQAQTRWQGALSARARHIEKELRGRGLPGPRIAQYLDGCRRELEEGWLGRRIARNGRAFYVTMYSLVVVAVVVAWGGPAEKTLSGSAPTSLSPATPPVPRATTAPLPPPNTPPATLTIPTPAPTVPPVTPATPSPTPVGSSNPPSTPATPQAAVQPDVPTALPPPPDAPLTTPPPTTPPPAP